MRRRTTENQYLTSWEVVRHLSEITSQEHEVMIRRASYWYAYYGLRRTFCSREPGDFVHDAFYKLLTGIRNAPAMLPLVETISFIIRSSIVHEARKRHIVTNYDINELGGYGYEQYPKLEVDDIIDQLLPSVENIQYGKEYLDLLRLDPELKVRDIASILNISPEKIYEIKRALKKGKEQVITDRAEK